jgi:hypothetical protein
LNAMWIYLLRRKCNNGRSDIVKAVERSEVSVPVNWYMLSRIKEQWLTSTRLLRAR